MRLLTLAVEAGASPNLRPLEDPSGTLLRVTGFPVQMALSTMSMGNMSHRYEATGGDAVRKRQILFYRLNLNIRQQVRIQPEHQKRLVWAGQDRSGTTIQCNGVYTKFPLPLTILPADAFPVIVTDSNGSFLLLFNGSIWSADQGVVKSAIQQTRNALSINPEMMQVLVGPGICPYCYVSEVHEKFTRREAWEPCVTDDHHIDLRRFILNDLLGEGVPDNQIYAVDLCTGHSRTEAGKHLFPSGLRSQRTGEPQSRYATVASL